MRFRLVKLTAQFVKARLWKIPSPMALGWNITSLCNFDCKYCAGNDTAVQELSYSEIVALMREFAAMGTLRIHFLGGEPLCREDIGRIVDEAVTLKIKTSLFTNGFFLKERFDDIKKIDEVSISLDGPASVQNYYRHPGSFEKIEDAISFLKSKGKRMRLITTLYKYNLQSIPFLIDFSKEKNVPIKFHIIINELAGDKNIKNLNPEKNKLRRWISYLIDEKRKNPLIINSVTGLKYFSRWPDEGGFIKCGGAGILLFQISPDGCLYACDRSRNKKSRLFPSRKKIAEAMADVCVKGCYGCWCSGTLDFNLAYHLKREAIFEVFKKYGI